jgi:hypothetical protein
MTDVPVNQIETPRRFQFDWIPTVLFHPKQAFSQIMAQSSAVWLTPMLVLTLASLARVLVTGSINQAAAKTGQVSLPPDFQYYSPSQQAQFMQAAQATQGPVFVFVFPALSALVAIWMGWLLVGGLIHLVLTLLGGRGDTGAAMNLVAWAALPFAIRDLVRAGSMLSTHQLIQRAGLSGFAPVGESSLNLFLSALLALVDIYVIWHVLLLIVGVRTGDGLSRSKAVGGVLLTVLLALCLQALLGFAAAKLGGMTIIRPFF